MVLQLLLHILFTLCLLFLTASSLYLLIFTVAYFVVKEPSKLSSKQFRRFAVFVPAHNEELLISKLCESLFQLQYPLSLREVFVVADNCNDRTVEICKSYPVNILVRNDTHRMGKGYALSWALEQVPIKDFDAIFIVDADNVVDPFILNELNNILSTGEVAIQCSNEVGNRYDSWFTQLLFVARTIGNKLYHHSKYKLGLSSNLMGNGMCFASSLLHEKGWSAFTAAEDWEYYAQLVEDGIKIGFAVNARVFHQESRSLEQATSQRLRWARGRFVISKRIGLKLFKKGFATRNMIALDSSLPLIFPNWSLQVNLTVIALLLSFLIPFHELRTIALLWSTVLLIFHISLFTAGVYLAGDYLAVLKAILCAPVFLAWKSVIDFMSLSGIYRGNKWIRTRRHVSSGD